MDCSRYRNAIQELVEGRVGPLREAELRQHLDACEACRALEADLRTLRDVGSIDEDRARQLLAAAAGHDPCVAAASVIHKDLCPENLVVDSHGALRAVDARSGVAARRRRRAGGGWRATRDAQVRSRDHYNRAAAEA